MNLLEVLNTDNLILDVDYDFFFNSEAQISDFPWKEVSDPNQLADFLHHYRDLKFEHTVAHDEALPLWVDKGIVGATCIHIDHHHDWYINPEDLDSQSLGSLDGVINCGNYAAIAAKAGIIKNYIWVYPDHYSDFNEIILPRSLAISGVKVKSYPYSEYKILIEPYIDIYKIKMAIMCLSPDFIPEKEIRRYFDLFKSDNEFRYRALDYAYEVIISDRLDPQRKYFRLNLSEEIRTFFHCSPIKNLTLLNSPSDVVHVSPSLSFASCYALSPDSKKGWIQGIDQIADKQETVYLIPPIDFQINSFGDASMYSIFPKNLKFLGKMNCCNHDFMIQAPLQVAHEQNIQDLKKYFYDHKVNLVNHNAIIDISRMGVNEKIQEAFSDWMSLSWDALILLKSTPFYLMLFSELGTEKPCIEFFPLVFWQRLASRCLYPLIPYDLCNIEDDGYHGLSHGLDVGLKCIIYGTALGIPTTTLFLSALCHDLVKQGKEDSIRSSDILFNLLNTVWSDYSSVSNNAAIEAINEHSRVTPTKNILSMVLRDADRARLAWERGFVPRYFTTDIGTEIALNGANFYGELQRRLMFSENVRLEIYASDIATEVILCNLGRRYVLESSNEINSARLNYFISIYNVSELIIFAEQLSREIINNLLINDQNIHYVKDISENINLLLTQDLIKTPLLNIIYIALATDFMTEASLNSILLMPVEATIHLELCLENINWIIANLSILASREVILVYSINPSVDKGESLNLIVNKLLEEKRNNPEAINLRIIFVYSWCWIEQPEDAITALSLARNNYSPLSTKTATRFSNDIFKKILEDVRRRRERCHECSLAINCLSSEYASTSLMPIEIPVHFDRFQNWQPYAAD